MATQYTRNISIPEVLDTYIRTHPDFRFAEIAREAGLAEMRRREEKQ